MDDPARSGSLTGDDDDRPPSERVLDVSDPGGLLGPAEARWLCEQGRRALDLLGVPGEVRAKLVDDAEMARAHEAYAGVPGTTDVLTFDLSGDPGVLDADVMLCVDEAARRASERGHDTARELLLYLVHGVLHCLGYDDHDEDAYERMHAAEDELLTRLGVGATFRREPAGGGS
jgi:probable rRNA maturation factor